MDTYVFVFGSLVNLTTCFNHFIIISMDNYGRLYFSFIILNG